MARLIEVALRYRYVVLIATLAAAAAGVYSMR
jgi:hypothetical protein